VNNGVPFVNPCLDATITTSTNPILKNMSCLARNLAMVIQVTLIGTVPCDPYSFDACPFDSQYLYAVGVVLGPTGQLLSRSIKAQYSRDSHILDDVTSAGLRDQQLPIADVPQLGLRLGQIFGGLTLQRQPAGPLFAAGVRVFVSPQDWLVMTPSPPLFTAPMLQQAFSAKYSAVLLAANGIGVGTGNGGGVYVRGAAPVSAGGITDTLACLLPGVVCVLPAGAVLYANVTAPVPSPADPRPFAPVTLFPPASCVHSLSVMLAVVP
jgi:hypothetical protein